MLLSLESMNDWIILNVKDTTTREVVLAREGKPADSTEWDIGRGRNPEDIYVVAEVRGPAHHLRKIYRTYFGTV